MVKVTNIIHSIDLRARQRAAWLSLVLLGSQMNVNAALEMKWYGTTCLTLSDGKSTLLMDPFFTRPNLLEIILNKEARSDRELVKKYLKESIPSLEGILVTHTHFDHIVDLATVLQLKSNISVVGPKNTQAFLKGRNILTSPFVLSENEKEYKIGNFKIKAFKIEHSKLPFGIEYAKGDIKTEQKEPMGWNDFKSNQGFSYYIEHPEGDVLIHPTAVPRKYEISKVDTLVVGLTQRNIEALEEKVLKKIQARQVIPVHNDYFFTDISNPIEKMPFYPVIGEFPKGHFPFTYKIGTGLKTIVKKDKK